MNYVEKVLQDHGSDSVWFYLKDEETKEHFKDELLSLKARWADGGLFEKSHNISSFMAVHSDHRVAFISILCWKIASTPKYRDSIVRIDYRKLIHHKTYLINESSI